MLQYNSKNSKCYNKSESRFDVGRLIHFFSYTKVDNEGKLDEMVL
jgi:hypothetical protein